MEAFFIDRDVCIMRQETSSANRAKWKIHPSEVHFIYFFSTHARKPRNFKRGNNYTGSERNEELTAQFCNGHISKILLNYVELNWGWWWLFVGTYTMKYLLFSNSKCILQLLSYVCIYLCMYIILTPRRVASFFERFSPFTHTIFYRYRLINRC